MKLNTLVAAFVATFAATSLAYAAPHFTTVDDINSTTMQQMPSDTTTSPMGESDAPGPLADNSSTNVGAIPPSNTMPDNSGSANSLDGQQSANNSLDPQGVSAASSGDAEMSADTATGDDDY